MEEFLDDAVGENGSDDDNSLSLEQPFDHDEVSSQTSLEISLTENNENNESTESIENAGDEEEFDVSINHEDGEKVLPPIEQVIPQHSYNEETTGKSGKKKQKGSGKMFAWIAITAVYALCAGIIIGMLLVMNSKGNTMFFGDGRVEIESGIPENDDESPSAVEGVAAARNSVVVISVTTSTGTGTGTGIVITQDGYIVTNHHVIDGALSISVKFLDGTVLQAAVRGSSPDDDLAVIKVDAEGLVPATFASSSQCYIGQPVYVIGTPAGVEYCWTTTKGIVSYIDREVKIYDSNGIMTKKLKLLQTDAMVNPGNSGGPLLNIDGEVVGIISMKLAGDYEGIGFAIPTDGAVEIINAIIRDGNADNVDSSLSTKRPVIGITGVYVEDKTYYKEVKTGGQTVIQKASDFEIKYYRDQLIYSDVAGLYVSSVTEGSDAEGKIEKGDVITSVNDIEVTSRAVLSEELNDHYPGDTVSLTFYRDGKYNKVNITLGTE